ncbi:MAG: hypothetical protein GC192_00055 [Bacteroidetes bacterium]|nr:hypothetical protein [Bacteroidota bacterium]
MHPQTIQQLIDEIEKSELQSRNAYLGFFNKDMKDDIGYIKANKIGLERLVLRLLRAILEFDKHLSEEKPIPVNINLHENWIDIESHFLINEIEPVHDRYTRVEHPVVEQNWYDKYVPLGCVIAVCIVLVAAIIGFISIGKWLFN